MFRRLLITAFCFTIASLLTIAPAKASDNLLKDKLDAINQGGNQESWLSSSFETNIVLGIRSLIGDIQFNDDGSLKTGWLPGGLIGTTNNFIGSLYQPPASGFNYIAHSFENFLGKPAYAQGVGFRGLEPLMVIWRGFRNAVYLLSSVIFIIIGMMIMLRVKISPQAVITLQNAIPNLITTLILVTFSYAIAGLLIDLSYFVQAAGTLLIFPPSIAGGFLSSIVEQIPLLNRLIPATNPLLNPDISVFVSFLGLPAMSTIMLSFVVTFIITGMLSAPFGLVSPLGTSHLTHLGLSMGLGSLAMTITLLILIVMILIWLLKFTFGLFRCYATLIFKIVIAPLEIGLGAFPNMKMGFSTWVTDVISNLAVFVFSYLLVLLSNRIIILILFGSAHSTVTGLFSNLINLQASDVGLWAPDILQTGTFPLPAAWLAVGAIGLSTLLLLSKLPEMIPQFIFMIKPSPWGQAIGQGLDLSRNPFISAGKTATISAGIEGAYAGAGNYETKLRSQVTTLRASGAPTDIAKADQLEKRADRVSKISNVLHTGAQHAKLTR